MIICLSVEIFNVYCKKFLRGSFDFGFMSLNGALTAVKINDRIIIEACINWILQYGTFFLTLVNVVSKSITLQETY
jgi:hypothetical protein